MNPKVFLDELRSREGYEGQIVVSRKLPERPPRYAELARPPLTPLARARDRAGPGPAPPVLPIRARRGAGRDLRRGHALLASGRDPPPRERPPHQPRHAPR